MPILSRRLQSQFPRRQAGSGQSLNVERRKRLSNAVHPAKSAVDGHNPNRISSVYRPETTHSTLAHSRTQLAPSQSEDVIYNMTSLPDVKYTANGGVSRTGSGSLCPAPLCPMPPSSAPPLAYFSRPTAVRQRRLPADERAREREALKRQQRLQVKAMSKMWMCADVTVRVSFRLG